ncbi:B12-binding domain-containing radical SAM protein [Candidatus Wolfebacteria bacterium]|nr:B12-binding domain-containing radical SAM protein [Candidatus Magasanikbacteria bacterium]MBI5401563.1 B12-binding domain-containing radical SAM protein [Candidatus Wolfebacteria bacterium]
MLVSLIISAPITDCYGFNLLVAQLKKFESRGVEVKLYYIFYDFNKYYSGEVVEQLVHLCKGSDLIGVSLLSSAYRNSIQITGALKEGVGCPIIWGGKHPTAVPEDCLQYADMVCISEGEDTLCELVEKMLSGESYDNISGLWIKKNGSIIKNQLRPIENNLDRFVFPDYSLSNKFILDKKSMTIRPMVDNDLAKLRKWYPTMITRGCPNCCTFCTNSTDFKLRKMRSRSVGSVIKEVKIFVGLHPEVKQVFFRDDCISAMPIEFIQELSSKWKQKVGLPCSCSGVIATSQDFRKKMELLTEGGFTDFKMGIQSGCEKVRRFVYARVGETDAIINSAVKDLHEVCTGRINYYMITDNPYEKEDELVQSIRFTSRLRRPFSLSLYSLNFYPGTGLFIRAVNDGIIKNKNEALQESTMVLKDTYLNKVFMILRYFEVPPFFIDLLTSKKLYEHEWFQSVFDVFFRFLFNISTPSRDISKPKIRKVLSDLKWKKKLNLNEFFRWIVWNPLELICICCHRVRQVWN